jgi:RNA polymerase sigma factor (sigma-70 family)
MTAPRSRPSAAGAASGPAETGVEDRRLVQRVVAGDAGALEEIYGRYGRACYALARRILVDEQLAQDVVQEVFLALWRDARRYDADRGAFPTWLLSMTHHKAVDAVRREENLRKRRATTDVLEERQSAEAGPEDRAWTAVRGERVRAALAELSEPQREALVLAYFGGYTQREIAGLTSTPLGTVKTRMLAGMRALRGRLDGLSDGAQVTT